ncbi:MAG: response regulator transcription factor [Gaiellaceae bacterium]|jgi:DNA-binding NarL/FixJ family response regulator
MTTVLIVDDHPAFRTSARHLLEDEGFVVVGEAADGQGALEQAEKLSPNVVLLDIQLPDIDGFEVAEELRRRGGGAKIILTSSRDAGDYGARIAESGARGFVPKGELSGAAIDLLVG